jgi:carbamoyl-phosphate synthase large subunit
MKATGEVMAISSSFDAALMKAIRSLELGIYTLDQDIYRVLPDEIIRKKLNEVNDERLFVIAEALRRGISVEEIHDVTKIDDFFICKFNEIVQMEERLKKTSLDSISADLMKKAKKMGFPDIAIAKFTSTDRANVKEKRKKLGINAVYKMVDTCAAEFEAVSPYYYSTYDKYDEVKSSEKKKVLVIGSGPIRIGQGIEFDYCSVHSVWALKEQGYETIIANNNPETVSTDFDTSDRLYFEPLTIEDVENIIESEKPEGVIVQFGGQTAIKLVNDLSNIGVRIFGTQAKDVDAAEDREKFDKILEKVGIPRPVGRTVYTLDEALKAANELIYPVLVRPSYVLGGQGMEIAYNDKDITEFMEIINRVKQEHPILIDKYLMGKEIEVDAICDGENILIPGIMEHLERAGVHSGDSISVYPAYSLDEATINRITEYSGKLAKELNVLGMINIQYVIEVNPRSSRTVPYISKVTGIPMVDIATKLMTGKKLSDFKYGTGLYRKADYVAVKVPVFSFEKLQDVDTSLGPEMKSTGEVLGIAKTLEDALYKGITATGLKLPTKGGGILMTVRDSDKAELIGIAEQFEKYGFELWATGNTAKMLNMHGIATNAVKKVDEGSPNLLDLISSGKIKLVINTPTKGRKPERDGFKIRRKSVEMSIPCVTSLDTAKAILSCIKAESRENEMKVIDLSVFEE